MRFRYKLISMTPLPILGGEATLPGISNPYSVSVGASSGGASVLLGVSVDFLL